MNSLSRYYDAVFKQRVVEYYLQNQPNLSFRYVANIFQIKGGHATVKRWFDRYNGTVSSLQQRYRSGRPPILNKQKINQYITEPIRSYNRRSHTIDYRQITNYVRQKTNINVSLRTVERYGKNAGIKPMKSIKRTYTECEYKSDH
jgi:transposase